MPVSMVMAPVPEDQIHGGEITVDPGDCQFLPQISQMTEPQIAQIPQIAQTTTV
jgi:hypothetical protein